MHKSLKVLIYTMPFWLFLILLWFMESKGTVAAGPGGILFSFLLIYMIIASLFFTALHWGVRVASMLIIKYNKRVTARSYRIGVRKAYYIASVMAFGPVLLLALNSVRQLKLTDTLLVGLFLTLAIFYITKREA